MMDPVERAFDLVSNYDVVVARQHAREMARMMGFGLTDQTRIATAVSEVARRALGNQGQITFRVVIDGGRQGVECTCVGVEWGSSPQEQSVHIPGGTQGIERLMDDFEFLGRRDGPRRTVVMRKWLRLA